MSQWWFFGPITKCLTYPLTTGTLVGLFMGDPMLGMLAGANINLVYLGWMSVGGTMPSNTMVAGIFGSAMTILAGADPTLATTFAFPFSMFGLLLNNIYMTVNAAWIHEADRQLEKGNLRGVRIMNFLPSFCMAAILYGAPAFLMVMFGSGWAEQLIAMVPESLINALNVVGGIMPALGIAMLLNYLGKKKLIPWFFGGFFLTVYSGLGLTAISIFAAIIAIIMYMSQNEEVKQTAKRAVKRLSVNKKVETVEVEPSEAVVEKAAEVTSEEPAQPQRKLSHSTLVKTWLWTTSTEACYNYERLQALGAANLMITPIRNAMFAAAIAANTAAVAAGAVPDQVFTMGFWCAFATVGGAGGTLCLIFATFIFSKRDDHRAIAKLALLPGICGISEPVVFGYPLVLNPTFAIPFLFCSPIMTAIALFEFFFPRFASSIPVS